MVEEARLGAHAVAPPRLHLPGAAAGRDRAREADDDLDLRALATEAASHGRPARRGRRARRPVARRGAPPGRHQPRGPGAQPAHAHRVRRSGDLAAHGRASPSELIATIDQVPSDEERARAMAYVAQSHMAPSTASPPPASGPTRRSRSPTRQRLRGRAPGGDGGEGLGARGRARPPPPRARPSCEEAADEAERTGDHVLAAQALVNLVWQARMSSRLDDARRARASGCASTPRSAGFDSLASYARVEALAVAGGRRRRPRRRPRGARPAARATIPRTHLGPQPAVAGRAAGRARPRGRRPATRPPSSPRPPSR